MRYEACHYNDVFISLTSDERLEAIEHGRRMYEYSQNAGFRDNRPFIRNGVDGQRVQELGSIAERAAAKLLGIEWTRWRETFQTPDLHHNIEVRLIGVDHYGLRVYDKDNDTRRVIGIIIERGRESDPYRVPGWINAVYAKRPEWRIDPLDQKKPMYAVPQSSLFSVDSLLKLITRERGG